MGGKEERLSQDSALPASGADQCTDPGTSRHQPTQPHHKDCGASLDLQHVSERLLLTAKDLANAEWFPCVEYHEDVWGLGVG